jgi:hypothetical protein
VTHILEQGRKCDEGKSANPMNNPNELRGARFWQDFHQKTSVVTVRRLGLWRFDIAARSTGKASPGELFFACWKAR